MSAAPDMENFARLVQRIHPGNKLLRAWALTGGVSAQITALEIAQADGTMHKMVVRQHGAIDLNSNPNIAADEYKLLSILQSAGVPAPAPIHVEPAGDLFSTPCLVIRFIDGATDFAPANLPDTIDQMASALAQMHRIDSEHHDLAFLPRYADHLGAKLRLHPDVLDESLNEGRIRAVLKNMPAPLNAPVLLHGDYWPGNLMWQAGRLSGVIDWEDAMTGDPVSDLGNARMEILWAFGTAAMQQFTARYEALMPALQYEHLPYLDLAAALRPAGRLHTWALDAGTERTMREKHREFVIQAFEKLSVRNE